ncbi:LacI family transcriptional regulator [Bacteroidia bacterium]|nr:LacI family transcriptional regulator [Bacteroidia bacterium]GHU56603.1 LacI family transcriptional regulator [Bacteroidia bacterium]
MKSRVSIKDIAEALGVSTATVSLVLSGKAEEGRVGKDIAEKIRETAKSMNYQPNGLARSLRIGRSQTIGLIVADISNPFFGILALHIQEEAERHGYTVIIANTSENDQKMGKMIDILKSRQVDGYIIVPTEHGDVYITQLLETKTPLVLVDRYFPQLQTNNVIVDNYKASFDATELLVNYGCKRIALFIYKSALFHMQERKNGYCDAMKKAGLYSQELIYNTIDYAHINEDIVNGIRKLLSETNAVDGIFFATNSISILGIKELLNQKVELQKQIKIICFDKSDVFDFMKNSISYVIQPIAGMGRTAVNILIEQITKEESDFDFVMCKLSTKLVEIENP